jgi:hypothetical protein
MGTILVSLTDLICPYERVCAVNHPHEGTLNRSRCHLQSCQILGKTALQVGLTLRAA